MKSMITSDSQMNATISEGVRIIGSSLIVNDNVSYENMELALQTLVAMDRMVQWCIGDAVNASERIFGEKYSQMLNITGLQYSYLSICASMANAFPIEERRNISFSHHRLVQKYDAAKRTKYLQIAIDNTMQVAEFRKYINQCEGKGDGSGGDDDNRKKKYVIGRMTAPVERGDIWNILSDENSVNVDAEMIEQLGFKPFTEQDTVLVICVRFEDDEPNKEQAHFDLDQTDKSTAETEVPFG